jgi:uncharacterized protein YndB with AHSA1/START domain
MTEPDRVLQVEVTAPPAAAWAALTDPATVRRYYFETTPRTTWQIGAPIDFVDDDGETQLTGIVLEFDPPRRLAHTFIATWYGERDDQGSLHWEIEATDAGSRITLVHRGARAATREGFETLDGSRHLIEAVRDLLGAA